MTGRAQRRQPTSHAQEQESGQERPILFNATMVRAILAGTKTQTRRVVRLPKGWRFESATHGTRGATVGCLRVTGGDFRAVLPPTGEPGCRLWVRETFALPHGAKTPGDVVYRADDTTDGTEERAVRRLVRRADVPWRPGIFMPRYASRLTLEVTRVRVQRLSDISERDAKAEGTEPIRLPMERPYAAGFGVLWDKINSKRPGSAWADNPWVWAITFRVVDESGLCRVCGCTDDWGCDAGCRWVNAEHTLCSECVGGAS